MDKPKNLNGQSEMASFLKKSCKNHNSTEDKSEQKVLRKGKAKNSKVGKEKHIDGRTDKEKTDIRNYFGKNATDCVKIESESNDKRGSNVFSFMMANRHKQDEAIREMQARELNEAEELLPNIMKSIPKEQLLANFISNVGKKTSELSNLMNCQQQIKPLEQNLSMNDINLNDSTKSDAVVHSVLSGKKSSLRTSKSVSFSKSVETIEIIKEPDEHTWEFIMDSELNRAKQLAFEKTMSNLCNYGDNLDINEVFKDEIEECMNGGKKRKKVETKPKGSSKSKIKQKNIIKEFSEEHILQSDKENVKIGKGVQLHISNFLVQPQIKQQQSDINFQSEFQKWCHNSTSDSAESVKHSIATTCGSTDLKSSEKDKQSILVSDSSHNSSQSIKFIKDHDDIKAHIDVNPVKDHVDNNIMNPVDIIITKDHVDNTIMSPVDVNITKDHVDNTIISPVDVNITKDHVVNTIMSPVDVNITKDHVDNTITNPVDLNITKDHDVDNIRDDIDAGTIEGTIDLNIIVKQRNIISKTTLRSFRKVSSEEKVSSTLRRSSRLPKKRHLDDFCISSTDINSTNGHKKKESITAEKSSSTELNSDKKMKHSQDSDDDCLIEIIEEFPCVEKISKDKSKKIASIFMKRENKPSPKPCPTVSKARHDFLFAETPTLVQNKQSTDEQLVTWPPFPLYNHIRQTSDDPIWTLPNIELPFLSQPFKDHLDCSEVFKHPLRYVKKNKTNDDSFIEPHPPLHPLSLHNILYHLKAKNPTFPVFKIFNYYLNCKINGVELFAKEQQDIVANVNVEDQSAVIVHENPLASKRKRPSSRLSSNKRAKTDDNSISENAWQKWIPYSWTDVFAPKGASQMIENEGVKYQLKDWLEEWKNKGEVDDGCEHKSMKSDDYSDSRDSDDELVNTVLLSGLPGIGKTSLVYALGQELGIKVLEINASVRRQGKHIMTQLSEATQSHSVSSINSSSLMSPLQNKPPRTLHNSSAKKCKSKRKLASDTLDSSDGSEKKKSMALILFEDIDIVFDDYDEGFMSAVSNFMATTKRPIILTCNQPLHSIRAKIRGNYLEAEMIAPTPAAAANYLQLMCLANGVFLNAKEVEHLVAANNGDIRKSILELQFWSLSGSSNIQWLKMDKSILKKTPSSEELLAEEVYLSDIFPNLSSRKAADVPISNGCMWGKPALPLISTIKRSQELLRKMHWSLVGDNLLTLLPFNYKLIENKKPKYPLGMADPSVKNAYDFQKYSWLIADDEMEQFHSEIPAKEEKSELSPSASNTAKEIINSLANFFNTMCDLDVLQGHKCDGQMRCNYLTPLDDTSIDSAVSMDDSDSISALASGVFLKEESAITKCLNSCNIIDDCLKATISSTPNIIFEPHLYRKDSETRLVTDLNEQIAAKVPLVCQPNRRGVAMDYLPFVRTVARQDQLGNAMKKFKRSSRYLSHLKMMGYYLSPDTCITISNFLI